MKNNKNRLSLSCGFTLTEMLVVIGIVVLLATLVMPAFTEMLKSNRVSTAKFMVRTMLARAQAQAISNQKYAGIRFQFDRDGWELGRQYMVLIQNDTGTTYRAVPDEKAIPLPEGVGLIGNNVFDGDLDDDDNSLAFTSGNGSMNDSATFSIIFSPTGQLVIKDARVRPRPPFEEISGSNIWIHDAVINHTDLVDLGNDDPKKALLFCDETVTDIGLNSKVIFNVPWCYEEPSTTGLYIFEVELMADVDQNSRFTNYVQDLVPLLVNRYTGELIEE